MDKKKGDHAKKMEILQKKIQCGFIKIKLKNNSHNIDTNKRIFIQEIKGLPPKLKTSYPQPINVSNIIEIADEDGTILYSIKEKKTNNKN